MKLPYTIWMLVLLIALGAYVFVFERKPVEPEKDKQESISTFDSEKLTEVELLHAGQKLVLKKEGTQWKMTEPMNSPVDMDKVTKNIDKIKDWKSLQVAVEDFKASEMKTFGLDAPYLTIMARFKGESAKEFLVGNKTPTSSGYYVLLKGTSKLYVSYTYIPDDLARLVREPPKPTPVPTESPSGSAPTPKASK